MTSHSTSVHGKFGELLQGQLPVDNQHFLVSLPINRYVHAGCKRLDEGKSTVNRSTIKSTALIERLKKHFGDTFLYDYHIDSDLPVGKGLGSSSADMVAVAEAFSATTGHRITNKLLCRFLRDIEPTDSLMYQGRLVCFDHHQVLPLIDYQWLPPLTVVGVDEGGTVDTLVFNRSVAAYTQPQKKQFHRLLETLSQAIFRQDMALIGEVATQSACIQQAFNPKKHLSLMMKVTEDVRACGVIVAHSGTYIGVLLDHREVDYPQKLKAVIHQLQQHRLKPEVFHMPTKTGHHQDRYVA